jgi:oxygen-independent coproporphyrinogen-3 oxidase
LGFGPSAFSYWNGERFRNIANLQRYALFLKKGQSPIDFREQLPYPSNLKELFAIHLRLVEGVSLIDFSPLPTETEAAIEKWIKEGLLSREKNRVRLTTRGMLFYDEIAADMI